MSQKYQEIIENGPMLTWFQIGNNAPWNEKDVWIFKNGEVLAQVGPNLTSYDEVREWKSDIQRISSGVRVNGMGWSGSDLDQIKQNCEKEAQYLNSIKIPVRQE